MFYFREVDIERMCNLMEHSIQGKEQVNENFYFTVVHSRRGGRRRVENPTNTQTINIIPQAHTSKALTAFPLMNYREQPPLPPSIGTILPQWATREQIPF